MDRDVRAYCAHLGAVAATALGLLIVADASADLDLVEFVVENLELQSISCLPCDECLPGSDPEVGTLRTFCGPSYPVPALGDCFYCNGPYWRRLTSLSYRRPGGPLIRSALSFVPGVAAVLQHCHQLTSLEYCSTPTQSIPGAYIRIIELDTVILNPPLEHSWEDLTLDPEYQEILAAVYAASGDNPGGTRLERARIAQERRAQMLVLMSRGLVAWPAAAGGAVGVAGAGGDDVYMRAARVIDLDVILRYTPDLGERAFRLASGSYPDQMPPGGYRVMQEIGLATCEHAIFLDCDVAVEPRSWGSIKAGFRD